VFKTPAEASTTKFDYIVCTNKAINLDGTISLLEPVIDQDKTTVVIIQNGVGNEDPFRKRFPALSIISCVVREFFLFCLFSLFVNIFFEAEVLKHKINPDMDWSNSDSTGHCQAYQERRYADWVIP
jgi:hypothetical protein